MSVIKNDGGPAFPQTLTDNQGRMDTAHDYGLSGMTLRDYFASAALTAIIQKLKIHEDRQNEYAAFAYEIADQMIQQRSK
jgi:hypothetical protein